MPEPPKRPRQPSRPDGERISVVDQAPEPEVLAQRRFDRPQPRKATMPGLAPVRLPGAPQLPTELAKTERAPSTTAATVRATPATGIRIPADETPPSVPPGPSAELLEARAELAEYKRRERVQVESRGPGPYQPPLRSQSPVPSSAPSKADAALGMTVRHLLAKALPFLLAAAGIGGGVTAIAKPSADPAKTDATLANVEAMRADLAVIREQLTGVIKREAARDQYTQCLESALDEVGEQLLPAQDRLANASPLRAYVKQRCARLRP